MSKDVKFNAEAMSQEFIGSDVHVQGLSIFLDFVVDSDSTSWELLVI
jgi:hypothetical protein